MNTGCFKCDKAQWDADGCTCKITGLLVGNAERGCEYRKDIEPKSCNPRNTKLRSCPFCGKEPTAFKDNYDRIAIMCENCDLYFGIELECGEELVDGWRARIKSVEEAVEMWNKRTQFDDGGYHDGA